MQVLASVIKWICYALLAMGVLFSIAAAVMEGATLPMAIFIFFLFSWPYFVRLLVLILRRKKETSQVSSSETAYVDTGNVVYRADGADISSEDVSYLIQAGLKKSIKEGRKRYSDHEEELSFLFSTKYASEVAMYEGQLYDKVGAVGPAGRRWAKEATAADISEKIRRCDEAIDVYNTFRDFCYQHGRGGQVYFGSMWEHCFNSHNPDFSYIESTVALKIELQQLLAERHAESVMT